jgi:hypothetical protein
MSYLSILLERCKGFQKKAKANNIFAPIKKQYFGEEQFCRPDTGVLQKRSWRRRHQTFSKG